MNRTSKLKRFYIGPRSLAEAKARQATRDAKRAARGQRPKGKGLGRGKGLKAKPDSRLAAWSRAVKKRDNNQCQWPAGCQTGDTRIDAHHKMKRSQRPDMKYNVDVGVALCRTHHRWTDDNHDAAVAIGLLDLTSYEVAQKEKRIAA